MPPTEKNQTDPMTNLLPRSAFNKHFKKVMREAREENAPVSLAFLDIDDFLNLNEEFGHAIGDQVIQSIAKIIQETIHEEGIGIRYGGDEFAILFPHTEREQAFLTVERIREAVSKMKRFEQKGEIAETNVTVTGGIASYPIDGTSDNEILRKADQALYRAKVAGRDNIRLAYEERMAPKTAHFTLTQLERLSKLSEEQGVGEAVLLREALDELLFKYGVTSIEK